ncbi:MULTISPECIES: YhcN/YlaJ family sporulation lipoprotein [Pontibacillus]|uniref:YhcN/YlaJ family sporulation lipoprotein n=1 Tax=Pontibacillus chungwhensis TaxID=265426 RepID=A0ABY8V482_9BACI|nr:MULTISPECIES: YhcN/YlaJ family sporulation lipoprotein [Pontibacillus]MCD5322541.1 YhcN/YlaJ family sporulation lipoprotein [Pontibacillus sp. HN14]WIF99826.1 YhcN/YlaJ family sporulation lipoprotein [Pontibacillus chungwhensis]
MKFIIVVGLAIALTACQSNNQESLPQQENQSPTIQVQDSDPAPKEKMSNRKRSKHLANVANEVPDVHKATAVVAGPYVVVAIDVDKSLDRSRVGAIKYSVAEALKKDPYGKDAVVIADADGYERVKQMGIKIRQGHPIQGITDELSAIVGRYMPEVPVPDKKPTEPDQDKEKLPAQKERELEQIQDDQSNNYKDKKTPKSD